MDEMDHFIKLPPASKQMNQPFWSVVIPTFNCAHFLKETLQSVLDQDLGPDQMEIIVVDDHSTQDDPESVVREYGKGRVRFIRQENNVGKVRNYETGLKESSGIYIHQLHGDDLVRPGFYAIMGSLLDDYPEAGAAFCRSIYIDEKSRWIGITGIFQDQEGIIPDMLSKLYAQQLIQAPSMVVKREVYEKIGTFDRRLHCMEDWEMWIRIANNFPIAMSNEVLALYRSSTTNTTTETFLDGSAIDAHRLVYSLVENYVEPKIIKKQRKLRKEKQTMFWLNSFYKNKNQLSATVTLKYITFIIRLSLSPITFLKLFR